MGNLHTVSLCYRKIFDIGVGPQVFTGRCVVSFRTFKFPLEIVSISSFGLLLLNSKIASNST